MEKVFYIDLQDVTSKEELHKAITLAMDLPEYYGNNLDALHDELTEAGEGCNIIFYNTCKAKELLGKYYDNLVKMCNHALKEVQNMKIRFYP